MGRLRKLAGEFNSVVADAIRWLRGKANEFKSQRKYKKAWTLERTASMLGDDTNAIAYCTFEWERGKLEWCMTINRILDAYGYAYHAIIQAYYTIADLDADYASTWFNKAKKILIDMTTEILRMFHG